jgi:hypothetical protein
MGAVALRGPMAHVASMAQVVEAATVWALLLWSKVNGLALLLNNFVLLL